MQNGHLKAFFVIVGLVVLNSCSAPAPRLIRYSGVIEREDSAISGYVISPRSSASVYPLRVYVRVHRDGDPGSDVICIEIPNAETSTEYGEIGDTVSFMFPGAMPVDGRVPIGAIADFRIQRRGAPAGK